MDILFIRLGLAIFAFLGTIHLAYTLSDLKRPKYFAPKDKDLISSLQGTRVAIAKNGKDFWLSYLGFNLSHSVGLLVYAFLFGLISILTPATLFHPAMITTLIATGIIYAVLSHKFWFSIPFMGSVLATSLFTIGLVWRVL